MDVPSVLHDKYYADFAPTKSAQAIQKAGSHLFCCEDLIVKGKLGNGYFASVFLVQHHPTNQLMAMKLTNEASVQRREMELLSSLNHENVIKFHGSCVIGARFACLTEFANGGCLSSLISAKGVDLPWSVRINLALDIAKGIHYLHSRNLIHRDLSSVNILIRMTPGPRWDTNEPGLPAHTGQLPYGLRVGQNVLVSDEHFRHQYLSDPKWPRRTPRTRQQLSTSINSTASPCSGSAKVGAVLASTLDRGEHMGDQSSSDCSCADCDYRAADSSPSAAASSCFRSLPTVVPVWHQLTWVAASRPRYTALVADLGLCLDLSQENADTVSLVGNPYYISPECLNRLAPYSFSADLFALGLLMCELITQLVNDGVNVPRTKEFGLDHENLIVPPSCPKWLLQIAVDCCTVEYRKRPTAAAVIDRLTEHLSSDLATPLPEPANALTSTCCSVDHHHLTGSSHVPTAVRLLNVSTELNGVVGNGQTHSIDA